MIHAPRHQQPGARVRYSYTDGPIPAGTLGTVLGFLGRSQQAQIRWDDDSISAHTPDEYDVVSRAARRTVGAARRGKKTFEAYASEVERALVASGVRPGEADVWISNHGSFIDQNFKRGIPSAETAERILESERHSAIPWVGETRRQTKWSDWDILDAVERHHGMTPEAKARALELVDLGYIDATGTWELTPRGRRAWERDAPKGGWSDRHQQAPQFEAPRQVRRQTVHATPTSGWASGKRPSHTEIWADGKPITVARSGRKWTVTVMGRPVVAGPSGGLTFEGRANYVDGLKTARFDSKGDADSVAHKIGRYMLDLGDFVYTYVEYVG
jgi:hypothetical protein